MRLFQRQFRKLQRFKEDNKAQYFFSKTVNCLNRWAYFVGLNILEDDFTPVNARLIFLAIFNTIFIINNIHSVYARRDDGMIEISICLTTIGLAFQGIAKQWVFCANYEEMQELIYSGTDVYAALKHDKIRKTARDYAFYAWLLVLHFLRYAYPLVIFVAYAFPIVYSHLFGEKRALPFEVEILFVDLNTDFGYWANIVYQGISCGYAIVGLVASDGIYLLLIFNAVTQLQNIFFELERLDEFIVRQQQKEIRQQLDKIIKLHQKYIW